MADLAGNEKFQQGRWSLHVEFDPYNPEDEESRDETYLFMMHVARTFGGLWEEIREVMRHEKGTTRVEVSCDLLDYLARVMDWVMFHTIPKEIRLVRNVSHEAGGTA